MQDGCLILLMEAVLVKGVEQRLDRIDAILPGLEKTLLGMQGGELGISVKINAFDLVTEADLAAEKCLVECIREHFPEDGIVTEEDGATPEEAARSDAFRWVLDPIDGTSNYAHRLPIWNSSIGLLYGTERVGGIVSAPGLGLRYRAMKDGGAICNGKAIQINDKTDIGQGIVGTGFPYDRARRAEPISRAIANMLRTAGGVRRLGAAALDFCFLADGRYLGYYEMALKPWDMAAGSLIAEEAGAVLSDFEGNPVDLFTSAGVVAAVPPVHPQLLEQAAPMREAIAMG
jgi:myo-inositol-1(or 4)-monophosphatase